MIDLSKKLRIADIVDESVVDGLGIRMTVFTQGCPHNCEGCHNLATHSFTGGREVSIKELAEAVGRNPLLDGVTFSGGEPFCQADALADFAAWLHDKSLDVWCYTGYTYEELCDMAKKDENVGRLLAGTDVLVDGPFELGKLDLTLKFRGSDNQRVIDMNRTRAAGEVVWLDNMR